MFIPYPNYVKSYRMFLNKSRIDSLFILSIIYQKQALLAKKEIGTPVRQHSDYHFTHFALSPISLR